MPSPTVTTYLWFESQAEEAVGFYTSLVPGSKITNVSRWGKGGPGPEGSVLTMTFELAGQSFLALNGGPQYRFTPAISLLISCETQDEVDRYWQALTAEGGKPGQCGWLEDRFGLSWQVVPTALMRLMSDPDPVKAGRVTQAMMGMSKIDIAALERAYTG